MHVIHQKGQPFFSHMQKLNRICNIFNIFTMSQPLYTVLRAVPAIIARANTEIRGYHLVNEAPIKESRWEDINVSILSPFCRITDVAKGDHASGKDIVCNGHGISNKSAMVSKKGIVSISSYRLTKVCSAKTPGDTKAI